MVDFEATYWNGFFLPKGTPAPIVEKLHDAAVATIDSPSVQARLKVFGLTVVAPDVVAPDVGVDCFPPPLEQAATRSAHARTHAVDAGPDVTSPAPAVAQEAATLAALGQAG